MSNAFLRLERLTCRTDRFCFGELDLQVAAGEYLMVTGTTGAGKTTLLELVAGLRQPTGGRIVCNGIDITVWPPEKRVLGFAYQDSLLFPFLTVRENILFGAKIQGRAKEAALQRRAVDLAGLMGIGHLLDCDPGRLSGGEKQRVSLTRALLLRPPLLLLDEPFAALDGETKCNLRELLRQLHRMEQMTVLHVSHDPEDRKRLGSRTVRLERGKLRESAGCVG
jgi:molybdate transport system ATP-binding protein